MIKGGINASANSYFDYVDVLHTKEYFYTIKGEQLCWILELNIQQSTAIWKIVENIDMKMNYINPSTSSSNSIELQNKSSNTSTSTTTDSFPTPSNNDPSSYYPTGTHSNSNPTQLNIHNQSNAICFHPTPTMHWINGNLYLYGCYYDIKRDSLSIIHINENEFDIVDHLNEQPSTSTASLGAKESTTSLNSSNVAATAKKPSSSPLIHQLNQQGRKPEETEAEKKAKKERKYYFQLESIPTSNKNILSRRNHTSIATDDHLFIIGGYSLYSNQQKTDIYAFNCSTNNFYQIVDVLLPLDYHHLSVCYENYIYLNKIEILCLRIYFYSKSNKSMNKYENYYYFLEREYIKNTPSNPNISSSTSLWKYNEYQQNFYKEKLFQLNKEQQQYPFNSNANATSVGGHSNSGNPVSSTTGSGSTSHSFHVNTSLSSQHVPTSPPQATTQQSMIQMIQIPSPPPPPPLPMFHTYASNIHTLSQGQAGTLGGQGGPGALNNTLFLPNKINQTTSNPNKGFQNHLKLKHNHQIDRNEENYHLPFILPEKSNYLFLTNFYGYFVSDQINTVSECSILLLLLTILRIISLSYHSNDDSLLFSTISNYLCKQNEIYYKNQPIQYIITAIKLISFRNTSKSLEYLNKLDKNYFGSLYNTLMNLQYILFTNNLHSHHNLEFSVESISCLLFSIFNFPENKHFNGKLIHSVEYYKILIVLSMKILLLQPDDIQYYQILLNNHSSSSSLSSESSISLDNHVHTHPDDEDLPSDDIHLNLHNVLLSTAAIYSSSSSNANDDSTPPLSPSSSSHKISTIYQSIYKSREIALKWLVFILKNIIKKNKEKKSKNVKPGSSKIIQDAKEKEKERLDAIQELFGIRNCILLSGASFGLQELIFNSEEQLELQIKLFKINQYMQEEDDEDEDDDPNSTSNTPNTSSLLDSKEISLITQGNPLTSSTSSGSIHRYGRNKYPLDDEDDDFHSTSFLNVYGSDIGEGEGRNHRISNPMMKTGKHYEDEDEGRSKEGSSKGSNTPGGGATGRGGKGSGKEWQHTILDEEKLNVLNNENYFYSCSNNKWRQLSFFNLMNKNNLPFAKKVLKNLLIKKFQIENEKVEDENEENEYKFENEEIRQEKEIQGEEFYDFLREKNENYLNIVKEEQKEITNEFEQISNLSIKLLLNGCSCIYELANEIIQERVKLMNTLAADAEFTINTSKNLQNWLTDKLIYLFKLKIQPKTNRIYFLENEFSYNIIIYSIELMNSINMNELLSTSSTSSLPSFQYPPNPLNSLHTSKKTKLNTSTSSTSSTSSTNSMSTSQSTSSFIKSFDNWVEMKQINETTNILLKASLLNQLPFNPKTTIELTSEYVHQIFQTNEVNVLVKNYQSAKLVIEKQKIQVKIIHQLFKVIIQQSMECLFICVSILIPKLFEFLSLIEIKIKNLILQLPKIFVLSYLQSNKDCVISICKIIWILENYEKYKPKSTEHIQFWLEICHQEKDYFKFNRILKQCDLLIFKINEIKNQWILFKSSLSQVQEDLIPFSSPPSTPFPSNPPAPSPSPSSLIPPSSVLPSTPASSPRGSPSTFNWKNKVSDICLLGMMNHDEIFDIQSNWDNLISLNITNLYIHNESTLSSTSYSNKSTGNVHPASSASPASPSGHHRTNSTSSTSTSSFNSTLLHPSMLANQFTHFPYPSIKLINQAALGCSYDCDDQLVLSYNIFSFQYMDYYFFCFKSYGLSDILKFIVDDHSDICYFQSPHHRRDHHSNVQAQAPSHHLPLHRSASFDLSGLSGAAGIPLSYTTHPTHPPQAGNGPIGGYVMDTSKCKNILLLKAKEIAFYLKNYFLENKIPIHKIIIAGHSIAGSLAALIYTILLQTSIEYSKIPCITFGSPFSFVDSAPSYLPSYNLHNFLSDKDIIPHIYQSKLLAKTIHISFPNLLSSPSSSTPSPFSNNQQDPASYQAGEKELLNYVPFGNYHFLLESNKVSPITIHSRYIHQIGTSYPILSCLYSITNRTNGSEFIKYHHCISTYQYLLSQYVS